MRQYVHAIFVMSLGLGVISAAFADDRLSIRTILDHSTDYQAKVVIVEGTAGAVTNIPVHRGAHRCGGSPVYDTQQFTLQDESGAIGVATAGMCQPNAAQLVHEKEHLRIRGVVVADEKDPKAIPVIYVDAIDRVAPSH